MNPPCQTDFEWEHQFYPQSPEAYQPYGLPCMPTQQRHGSYVGTSSHVDGVSFDNLRRHFRTDVVGMRAPGLEVVPLALRMRGGDDNDDGSVPTFMSYSRTAPPNPSRLCKQ